MSQEAYQKDGKVLVVHRRERGQVFYHVGRRNDLIVSFEQFRRMEAGAFDAALSAEKLEPLGVGELPAYRDGRDFGELIAAGVER